MRISDWSSDVCSSDLLDRAPPFRVGERAQHPIERGAQSSSRVRVVKPPAASHSSALFSSTVTPKVQIRSEEHTSELQSLMRISYAVFCLKKKNINIQVTPHTTIPYHRPHTYSK